MFKQNVYTAAELWWHKQITFALTAAIYYLVGFEWEAVHWLILNLPFPQFLSQAIKSVTICFWAILPAYIAACVLKLYAYRMLAFIWGYEPLQLMDTFWMYDTPANPINVPAYLVFNKPKNGLGATQMAEQLVDRLFKLQGHRCDLKWVKYYGMWFL